MPEAPGLRECNVGKWESWYSKVNTPGKMGSGRSYTLAAKWLADCATVEDWGCGPGGAPTSVRPEQYRGLDGTTNPFVDQVVDLATHVSQPPVDGILLRHVLEHNWLWRRVLANALQSARQRLAVVTFVPLEETERNRRD